MWLLGRYAALLVFAYLLLNGLAWIAESFGPELFFGALFILVHVAVVLNNLVDRAEDPHEL